jgi:mannan endo-1,4-beta-mannosidase
MKKTLLILIIYFFDFMIFSQVLPGFRVDGRFLYDYNNEKVILRGANAMIVYWDKYGLVNYPELAKTGANCCRIFWKLDYPSPTPSDLDKTIENCLANDMIPIPCLWEATGDWSQFQKCVDFWCSPEIATILQKYDKHLILNIANEVGNDITEQSLFRSRYKSAVEQIRNAGIHVPLIIDSDRWGRNAYSVINNGQYLLEQDPDHNLMFSWHLWDPQYWELGAKDSIKKVIDLAVAENICFIVGEFGPCEQCDNCTASHIEWEYLIEYCHQNEIGWLSWVWRWTDCHSMITYDPGNYGDWANSSWGESIAVSSPYSIQNTSFRPGSITSLNDPDLSPGTNHFKVFPNPANHFVDIEYYINEKSSISIDISDLLGRKIITQINKKQSPGLHQEHLNLCEDNNQLIADGIYIVQLRLTNDTQMDLATGKIQIIR